MHNWGIFNGHQLKQHSLEFLNANFGKSGQHYYNIVRGIQHSKVKPQRQRKSIAAERTYSKNINASKDVKAALNKIAEVLETRMSNSKTKARTLTLKLKYSDFQQITRSRTLDSLISEKTQLAELAFSLYKLDDHKKSIRLLGISMTNFELKDFDNNNLPNSNQLSLAF